MDLTFNTFILLPLYYHLFIDVVFSDAGTSVIDNLIQFSHSTIRIAFFYSDPFKSFAAFNKQLYPEWQFFSPGRLNLHCLHRLLEQFLRRVFLM